MQFSDFPLLALKFTKFLMSFFKQKLSFSSKFGSFFSFTRDNSSVLFWLKLYYWPKYHIKVQIFRLATIRIKIRQIPHVIFGTNSQFFFKLCITLQCLETTLLYFLIYIFIFFRQEEPIKKQISRLLAAPMKTNQIPYIIFQARSQFSFKFCITLQCRNT